MQNSGGTESAANQTTACNVAIDQVRGLPSIGSSYSSSCSKAPLVVSSVLCSGSAACNGSSTSADGQEATVVTVSYTVPSLFRMPFNGPGVITRSCEMKLRNIE